MIIVVLVLVLCGGGLGLLALNGTIKLGKAAAATPKPREVPPGMVLVPFNVRTLPTNTLMTRELLVDPRTGAVIKQPINKALLQGGTIMTEAVQIVGRVLRHEMRPGYVFIETDFYPKGTSSGVVAAIPPGKRAVTLDVSKLSGARTLKSGDHVDLLAAQAYDPARIPGARANSATGPFEPPVKQAAVKVLAQDGVVVSQVTVEQIPYAGGGAKIKTKPVEQIEVAVDPQEVPGLMEAIASNAEISCIAHSGQPEKPGSEDRIIIAPPPPPPPPPAAPMVAPVTRVESIVGKRHQVLVLPGIVPSTQPTPGSPAALTQAGQP